MTMHETLSFHRREMKQIVDRLEDRLAETRELLDEAKASLDSSNGMVACIARQKTKKLPIYSAATGPN